MEKVELLDEKITQLEGHFRPCACRSDTPFFSFQSHGIVTSAHRKHDSGNVYRTVYQHDRDKILYAKHFRGLRLKSQIFPEHAGDFLRTRMDHSLEVAQIARHFAAPR